MLTPEDIKAIVQAGKEIYATKEDLATLELKFDQKFDKIITALDGIAKNMLDYHQEAAANRTRLERMEEWIKQAAEKIGLQYKA